MRKTIYKLLLVLFPILLFAGCTPKQEVSLTLFAGSASQPPLQEIIQSYETRTGIKVYGNYGGSGTVLSQMKLTRTGDLYIPGSPDFMVTAKKMGAVNAETIRELAFLVPVIAVQPGNPKNIKSLADLAAPGIRVGLGNPESVCLGLYAVEVLENNNLLERINRNVVTYTESCEKTATILALKSVDAVIGWDVFDNWNPDNIEVVFIKTERLPRIAYIPAAISAFSKNEAAAQKFLDYLTSSTAQDIFRKWGYLTSAADAEKIAPGASIGGEYKLPLNWREGVK